MVYPWGVKVVRTITLFRLANGYVCRIDSGWKAESDGKFDFSYKIAKKADDTPVMTEADIFDHFEPPVAYRLPHTDLEQKCGKLQALNSL